MPSINIEMLQIVAKGLAELKDDMVFVGGAVAELYVTDPAASEIRPTIDVDCVVELRSRTEHTRLEEKLRAKGFAHDISEGAPICRWIYKDVKVDIMPTDENILGFSNKWYIEGIENRMTKLLPDKTGINIFPAEYYLATKFEAHKGRGGSDLRQSHDFEDIIYILDNCSDIVENIMNSNSSVRGYLKEEFKCLLKNKNLTEGIETALPYGSGYERTKIIEDCMRDIAHNE